MSFTPYSFKSYSDCNLLRTVCLPVLSLCNAQHNMPLLFLAFWVLSQYKISNITLCFLLELRPVTIQKITPPGLLAIISELTAARTALFFLLKGSPLIQVEFKTIERSCTIYNLCGSIASSAVFEKRRVMSNICITPVGWVSCGHL